jgi:hypothetical protein
LAAIVTEGDDWVSMPGYNVTLDDGRWMTIGWEMVEAIGG